MMHARQTASMLLAEGIALAGCSSDIFLGTLH